MTKNKEAALTEKSDHILAKDVLKYKTSIDKKRLKALGKLIQQAQKLNMGYRC